MITKKDILNSFFAMIAMVPCLAVLNNGEQSLVPNFLGLVYCFVLYKATFTKYGKQTIKSLYKIVAFLEINMKA